MMDLLKHKVHSIIKDRMVKCIWDIEERLNKGGEF